MRLLHTSDWHLGRSFHGVGMLDAQAAMIEGLLDVVRSENVDAVLVSGDLYDRALPPVDAVELWGSTLERLTDLGCQVVVISGNHDSARRLGGGARLLERAGVHIRCDVARAGEPVALADDHGEVAVYAVPYLEPEVARHALGVDETGGGQTGESLRTHGDVLRAALRRCRADAARRKARSVVMAHAFVAGGAGCDSERELAVGGAGQVSPSLFADFDYTALGHLHGAQTIGDGSVRYAGSPLAYSFSEDRHRKGSWLVELDEGGLGLVEAVPSVVPRPLVRLRGTLDELLSSAEHAHAESAFVSVTLTDAACPVGAMARVQRRFPHAVELSWQPEGGLVDLAGSYAERVRQPDDLSLLAAFVTHVRNTDPTEAERELLAAALDDARLDERVEV